MLSKVIFYPLFYLMRTDAYREGIFEEVRKDRVVLSSLDASSDYHRSLSKNLRGISSNDVAAF